MSFWYKKKRKFGEIAVEKGLASKEQVEDALKVQRELLTTKQIQKKIGIILNEKGVLDLEDIERVLDEQRRDGFILKGIIYSIFNAR